ncbi:hypothetical protein [Alkaliphilus peptidifermentans]|uniref:HEAT repeat-containing protein n=1 Tax=Alkaliphilus peptidifermentans DSM 18978 TaxID=1120976 RepID=A0A1G5GT66_9FIRM|nr:hypothetical protein [Alkaliphilus peptidifermentans]SCY54529.1 hypothetical protein SAMN03080606_01763 [Alkaliphilus peptidifermentans DSM 18978]
MKSSIDDLKKRGYIENIDMKDYQNLSHEELYILIKSQKAYERTIAARLLGENVLDEVSDILIEVLSKEKNLYTKIEICNVLEKCSTNEAKKMIVLLGKIGDNQHHTLPQSISKKVSYPLPRDIIARTLAKMNIKVLPLMIASRDIHAIREIIDSIGFMCFYNNVSNEKFIVGKLVECFEIHKDDEIIRWKIVMAFSSFQDKDIVCRLEDVKLNDKEALIREEAKRSLSLIKRCI